MCKFWLHGSLYNCWVQMPLNCRQYVWNILFQCSLICIFIVHFNFIIYFFSLIPLNLFMSVWWPIIKCNLQRHTVYYKGISHAFRTIFKEDGFLGLYKGLWSNTTGMPFCHFSIITVKVLGYMLYNVSPIGLN